MRFVFPLFAVVAGYFAAQASPPAAFEGIDESISQLAKITGLAPLKKVQYDTITRPQVKLFLEERIREEIKPEDIRIDELALKKFGFVPADFNLERTTVDLITEQAAAFYDYRKKKLFLLDGDSSNAQEGVRGEAGRAVLVHELAHALADQHFDLGKFIRHGKTDDASTARMAVMEGQATWLMVESMAEKMGSSVREMPQLADVGVGATEAMASQYPVLATAPLYIRASLIFPYSHGLKFQHALVQKIGNQAFSRVFREPPTTTQQVIHPDLYLKGVQPVHVSLPAVAKPKDWKTLVESTVGEFDHAILLEQYASKADAGELSPSWRGGSLALAENKAGKHVGLFYASEWKDAESARRMFDAYRRVLNGKWKTMSVTRDLENVLEGTGDDGLFRVTLDGTRVTSVEGMKTAGELAHRID